MAVKAEWSSPPKIMRPGESYTLDFYLGVVEGNSSYYKLDAWTMTELNGNKLENSYVKLNWKTDWQPINETLVLEPREGRTEGQRLKLELVMSSHIGMKTVYIYEWMNASDASKLEDPAPCKKPGRPEVEETDQKPTSAPELIQEVPKDENGNYIDSGIRFT